ncbi:MAG: sigma 54-interacting transcriptional regulator, partial [Nitrospira sp.]|nr:sigma 54-interacting transcriptional regulator [Nitrospira sp.]
LVLDEVGDLLHSSQVNLLRFLQEGTFERVGGQETLHVDTRVIAATNVDLKAAMDQNRFREDLYYRLGVLHIHLPPLRDRGEDALLMAMVFLQQAATTTHKTIRGFSVQAIDALRRHSWPGNVRELKNRVRRAVVMSEEEEITRQDLDLSGEDLPATDSLDSLRAAHQRIETELLIRALTLHRGNMSRVARDLQVSRSTLYRKLKQYGLETITTTLMHPTVTTRSTRKQTDNQVLTKQVP